MRRVVAFLRQHGANAVRQPRQFGEQARQLGTAHGFITWAAATLFGAVMLGSAVSSLFGAAGDATAALGSSDAQPDVTAGAAATVAMYTALSMIIGAFIACVAAAIGGRQRDQHP